MKLIVAFIILLHTLFAYEEPIDDRKAFDALLFKMGITSLTKDFEIEKENIYKNTNDIEELKKQVQYLLQENMKLKLKSSDETLYKENTPPKITQYQKARVRSENGVVLTSPLPKAQEIKVIPKDTIIEIEFCNKYGWCKLANQVGYIAIYKLSFKVE